MQRRYGLTAFHAADGVPRDTTLQSQGIHAQPAALTEFLIPPRQTLEDVLGVVVDVVVIRRGGHRWSSPEFVGHELATREWWDGGCSGFDLVTSTESLNEAAEGDPEMAKAPLEMLRGLRILPVTEAAAGLARTLVVSGLVPAVASPDAVHVALASVHQIDFRVTWNFKHIANPHTRERMRTRINASGYRMPVMCNPEELLNDDESI